MKSTVMFTVLPRGRVGNQVKLSLFVTPKVKDAGDGTILSATPFNNWLNIISKANYRVVFGREEDSFTGSLDNDVPDAKNRFDTALWAKFFPSNMLVQNFPSKRYTKVGLSSFATNSLHDDITSIYQSAAGQLTNQSVGPNGNTQLTARVANVAAGVSTTSTAATQIVPNSHTTADFLPSGAIADNGAKEYVRLSLFYNRDNWYKEHGLERPDAPQNDHLNDPEFHSVIGALGDHPTLLRRLGFVIDLTVTLNAPVAASGGVRVAVTLPSNLWNSGNEVICPRTLYSLTDTTFSAILYSDTDDQKIKETSALTTNGMLPLDGDSYLVTHLDVDHAASEFIEFSLNTQNTKASTDTVPVKLPALRTAGFGIYREDREAYFPPRLNRPYAYENTPTALNFTADELIRGYRFDVSEQQPNGTFSDWNSLCQRVTTATPSDGSAPFTITDEGVVKASQVTSTTKDESILQVHESLARWNGWSLVADRPGRTAPNGSGKPEFIEPSGSPVALKVRAKPGSLTRLRLGKTYRFRARVTDLAGNDLAHTVATAPSDTDSASAPRTFKRYEPVVPPTLLLRNALTEGESLEHVVIRSNPYGKVYQDNSLYAQWANGQPKLVGKLAGPMNVYNATSERHVAPPKTSYNLAEVHGAFDGLLDNPSLTMEQKVKKTWAVATKEEGSFYDSKVTDTSVNPPALLESGCQRVTPSSVVGQYSDISPMPERFDRDPLSPGQYVIYNQDGVRTPYLPDVNSPGFAIHGDIMPKGSLNQPFSGSWPEIKPVRLVLAGDSAVSVQPATSSSNALKITLPPGMKTTLHYASTVADATVMELAQSGLTADIQAGKHPVLSPPRDITLVHAVQQPMWPTLRDVDLKVTDRGPGETTAFVSAPFGVDGLSTNHVDAIATWSEVFDNFSDSDKDPRLSPTVFKTTLCSFPVKYADQTCSIPVGTPHAFGDTKRRDVTYKITATTRYREYFPPSITQDVLNITNDSDPAKRVIRSTARPPVPKVLYSVPNFRWSQTGTSPIVSQRKGGIRVYVDRGWFASGADERLAVILQPKGTTATRPEFVSVWGNDPIVYSPGDLTMIDESAFVFEPGEKDSDTITYNVDMAEGFGKVTVVAFKPKFHPERKVWYFDIGIDPKTSYFPFVRLAVARFQPMSITDVRLSKIVQCDFVQVSAVRTTTVIPQTNTFQISVDGIGGTNVTLKDPAQGLLIDPTTNQWQHGASGHVVKVEFQEAVLDRADDLDFKALATATLVPYAGPGASASNPVVSFKGTLNVPQIADPGAKHRLLIREYERYVTDAQDGVAKGTAVVHDGSAAEPYTERLVYLDSITVTI